MAGELLVVLAPLILIPEDIIGRINSSKDIVALLFVLWIFQSVRVVGAHELAMRSFDFIERRGLLDAKALIEILGLPVDCGFRKEPEKGSGMRERSREHRETSEPVSSLAGRVAF
jgi:hypothetical protein